MDDHGRSRIRKTLRLKGFVFFPDFQEILLDLAIRQDDCCNFASTWVWASLRNFSRDFQCHFDITEFSFCNAYFSDCFRIRDLFCQGNKSKLWASGMHFKTLQNLFRVNWVHLHPISLLSFRINFNDFRYILLHPLLLPSLPSCNDP